jgi:predicted RNA-binding Zn-ribbon protein involved in translation (DUF1610 family)
MGVLFVVCPYTAQKISTGIDIEEEVLKQLPLIESPLHCPACGQKHTWRCVDAFLGEPKPAVN